MDSFYPVADQLRAMTNQIKSEEQLATLPNHVIKYFLELLSSQSTEEHNMPSHDMQKLLDAHKMLERKTAFRCPEPSAFSSPESNSSHAFVNPMDISQLLGIPEQEVKSPKKRKLEIPQDAQYHDDIKYLMGKRGGCQVLWKGHRYTRDRTRNEQTYWACVLKRPPYRCKGRISTRGSYVTSATGHNHVINPSKVAIATLTHEIKSMARSQPEVKSHDIVMHCIDKLSGDGGGVVPLTDIPRIRTLKKMCQRESKKLKVDDESSDSELRPNISISQLWNRTCPEHTGSPGNLGINCLTPQAELFAGFNPHMRSSFSPPSQIQSGLSRFSQSPPSQLQSRLSPPSQLSQLKSSFSPVSQLQSRSSLSPPSQLQMPPRLSPPSKLHSLPSFSHSPPSCFSPPSQLQSSFSLPTQSRTSPLAQSMSTGNSPQPIPKVEALSPMHTSSEGDRQEEESSQRQHTLDVIEMLYRVRAAESTVLEQDIENTKHQLSLKEDRIKSLKGEVSKLDVALKIAQEGLRKSMTSSDEKVDKGLIKNFFTQYVTVSDDRKEDVLKVISAILGYTEDELREIELTRQHNGKWLPTLFAKSKQSVQAPPVGESFSELFVSFLETEANKAALPPRARHTSQQSRPVSTPPVSTPPVMHTRTSSTSSVGSPIRASPIPSPVRAATMSTKSNRRSPASGSSGLSASPPPVAPVSLSVAAPPLVPSSLADLLSTKQS